MRDALRCLSRLQRMEPLWSPVVATGGNRWQIARGGNRRNQAKTVAVGCDQLRKEREGVAFLAPQEAQVPRTRRPAGLDGATLTPTVSRRATFDVQRRFCRVEERARCPTTDLVGSTMEMAMESRLDSDYTRTWSPSGEVEYVRLANGTRLLYLKRPWSLSWPSASFAVSSWEWALTARRPSRSFSAQSDWSGSSSTSGRARVSNSVTSSPVSASSR